MIKVTRHMKMPLRLRRDLLRSIKQACLLAIAWSLSCGPVVTAASFASLWQWSPVQAKVSQKPRCCLPHVLHSTLLPRKPVRGQTSRSLKKAGEDRGGAALPVQGGVGQPDLKDKQHSFVPCVCLVACTSGIPQSWPQHRWHRCSWKLCSFPVAPSRV